MQWANVYVFISSTFNDMHAERDYLVKNVFPELSAWCEDRKIRLIDIDLRWGVSEADATQNKRVVQVCLDRIDACRPFFIGFMGQRRGWVPNENDINSETYNRFPLLLERHYSGSASVTEMEILHALIDPLHNGIRRLAEGKTQNAEAVEHAFFFLRDPGYLENIKNQALLNVYTNEAERDPANADRELTRWRNEIIPGTGRPVYDYTARWCENEATYEIAIPLDVPTTAPRGSDLWKIAYAQWAKNWNALGIQTDETGTISGAELEKAKAYNAEYTKGRLGNFRHGDSELADIIIAQLKNAITQQFGERTEEMQTPLQREIDQQAQFLQIASEGFIKRDGDFDEINSYLQGDENKPFAITAFAGMGKTSLLAHFIDEYKKADANETLHYRFVGGSDDSASVERLVRSLLSEIKEQGKIAAEIPASSAEMMQNFHDLLEEAGRVGKTIIIIDALNQLETGMGNLGWIPAALPDNVKLIVSFKRGEDKEEEYYKKLEQNNIMILHDVKPFRSLDDREKLVREYLSRYFKELDKSRIQALIGTDSAENPLFLKIALSELRLFGVHSDLNAIINNTFGISPVTAFHAVLSRIESDPSYTRLSPQISIPHIFGWLAHSKYGLSDGELIDLLIKEGLTDNRDDAQDAIYLILRQLRPYLAKRDGRIDFFYESFKIACLERYTKDHAFARSSEKWHVSLAEYFDTLPLSNLHKLMEQAWQFAMGNMEEQYKQLLFDYTYIEARLNAFDIDALIADYSYSQEKDILKLHNCLQFSAHILLLDKEQLPCQLWGRLADSSQASIQQLLQTILAEKKDLWMRPLRSYLQVSEGALLKTIDNTIRIERIAATADLRRAVTYGDWAADSSEQNVIKLWDLENGLCINRWKSDWSITRLAITPDGRYAVAGNHKLEVWDVETGRCVCTMEGHSSIITGILITPDGKKAISSSTDETIKIWDLFSGTCLRTITGHKNYRASSNGIVQPNWVHGVAMTADGRKIISAAEDCTLKVWFLGTGDCLYTICCEKPPAHVAITPDGNLAVVAHWTEITVWDIKTKVCLHTLTGHIDSIYSIVLSKEGNILLSTSRDKTIKVWDINTGACLNTLEGHSDDVFGINLAEDRVRAVSCSQDGTIKIWDISKSGASSSGKQKHLSGVKCILYSDDGSLLFSAEEDNGISSSSIRVWDTKTGNCLHVLEGHRNMIFQMAQSGNILVSASNDMDVRVWDIEKGICLHTLKGHGEKGGGGATGVVITSDGKLAVSCSFDKTLRVWSLESGACLHVLEGHDHGIDSISLAKDERYVVSSAWKTIKVWDIIDGKCTLEMQGEACFIIKILLTRNGRFIISAGANRIIEVWDMQDGSCVQTMNGAAEATSFQNIALSPDDKYVISVSSDKTAKVWDIDTGECVITFDKHKLDIVDIAVSPDGRFAYTVSRDKSIKMWNIHTGEYLCGFVSDDLMTCIAVSPDGQTIAAGGSGGSVYLLKME